MLGSILGAGLSAVGSIFGGISASKAMKNVKNSLNEQKAQNSDWFNRRFNEDATQRADAQRILTKTEEMIKNRNRQAAGQAAVMGGTDESVATTKAANAQALAEAASQIQVGSEARKDGIEAQYQQRDAQLEGQLNQMELNKAQNVAKAVGGVGQAAAGIAGAF